MRAVAVFNQRPCLTRALGELMSTVQWEGWEKANRESFIFIFHYFYQKK